MSGDEARLDGEQPVGGEPTNRMVVEFTDEGAVVQFEPLNPGEYPVPDKEAVAFARAVVQRVYDKYERFTKAAESEGNTDSARRFRAVTTALRRDLLGFEDGGCVIVAFDQRWLDDGFRSAMASSRPWREVEADRD